jgi:hypothetical protein
VATAESEGGQTYYFHRREKGKKARMCFTRQQPGR